MKTRLTLLLALSLGLSAYGQEEAIPMPAEPEEEILLLDDINEEEEDPEEEDILIEEAPVVNLDSLLRVRDVDEILLSLPPDYYTARNNYNRFRLPRIFNGYRAPYGSSAHIQMPAPLTRAATVIGPQYQTPEWLASGQRLADVQDAVIYDYMIDYPWLTQGVAHSLYRTPDLPDVPEAETISEVVAGLELPELQAADAEIVEIAPQRKNWLHVANAGIQFSQAYLSPNWYQGGNNYLALLVNGLWDVQLNQVYHPNLMFQNTVSYKLGLNSTPQDKFHKYSISEDLFQWNMKFGVKAFDKWFYSVTGQLKTQLLRNYDKDSEVRKASFLSPGDLNLGLGMTYSKVNAKKTFKLDISISPIAYNLKSCIDPAVNPESFGISAGKKFRSEIGSTGELTFDWTICSNVNYKSRVFLFSDYTYFLGDWENTMSFSINRFLSTQLYWRVRYDSSSVPGNGWGHWMVKEILSFGFSYNFSTKV